MKWLVAAVLVIGCKYPDPGFDPPRDDGAVDGDDGSPDMMVEPRCPMFTTANNKVQLPGIQVAGMSVVEDESFAISWLHSNTIGYTLPPLGEVYMMTDLVNNVTMATVLGDGSALYLLDGTQPRSRRAINNGSPASWLPATASGLPNDQFPGRPTDDDQLVAFADEGRGSAHEWERVAGTWTHKKTYSPADLGFDPTAELLSMNLSPDGAFLVIAAGGANDVYGIYWRVRGSGGSFSGADGAYGGRLVDGTYDQPHVTMRCSHLFARNTTTGYIDRLDLHP